MSKAHIGLNIKAKAPQLSQDGFFGHPERRQDDLAVPVVLEDILEEVLVPSPARPLHAFTIL